MLLLAIASVALAYLSWRFVETPFRQRSIPALSSRRAVFTFSAAGAVGFIALGAASDNSAFFKLSKTEEQIYFFSFLEYDPGEQFRTQNCFLDVVTNPLAEFDREYCLRPGPAKNYVLLGDSHAALLWQALQNASESTNIIQATASGCRPLANYSGQSGCTDLMRYILEDFLAENEIDGVILSARWLPSDLDYILPTVEQISRSVDRVVILGPTIEYLEVLPIKLGFHPDLAISYGAHDGRTLVNQESAGISNRIHQLLAGSAAEYVPLIPAVCPDGTCKLVSSTGETMSFDYGHFTLSGAEDIVAELVKSGELSFD